MGSERGVIMNDTVGVVVTQALSSASSILLPNRATTQGGHFRDVAAKLVWHSAAAQLPGEVLVPPSSSTVPREASFTPSSLWWCRLQHLTSHSLQPFQNFIKSLGDTNTHGSQAHPAQAGGCVAPEGNSSPEWTPVGGPGSGCWLEQQGE
ncbi:uncharacterized protein LOC135088943 isoform X2 [Scylla paramamosain]|uniref:uncharacterized protein LOC135088943 isoform X2 n=1 Tax=Scylla paramamosain TaxID=85552 RepID=UPI003082951D